MSVQTHLGESSPLPESLTIHVGDVKPLLDRATHTPRPTEIVLAPVELHRRNLKLRLTEANRPLDAFEFTGPSDVATRILQVKGLDPASLDRVDRLTLLEDILSDEHDATEHFRMVLGGEPAQNAKVVEQARTELEATTNYHPTRVEAFRRLGDAAPSPIDVDVSDLIDGTLAVERALRWRAGKAPSTGELLRRAARDVRETDGTAWQMAYPAVERIAIVGLSDLPAPLVDLVKAIAPTSDVELHFFLRGATGEALRNRLPAVWSVPNPGEVVIA